MHTRTRAWALVLASTLAGCSQEAPSPAPGHEPKSITNPLEAPGAYLEGVVDAKFEAERKLWLADLQQRIQAFDIANSRKPGSLAELAAKAPLPKIPHFMEFKYDPQTGEIDIVRSAGK